MSTSTLESPTLTVYQRGTEEVIAALGSDARRGLTSSEARTRLDQHGRNELPAREPPARWRRFAAQFQNTLVILLLIATIISAVLWWFERDAALPYEALAIFAVVLLNATMGFVQESRAEAAVAALRAMSAAEAAVVREGVRQDIPAAELVPGDIILIEEGDTIPADARVIESIALQTAEAALTGESLPVAKETAAIAGERPLADRENMVFSGTAATYGHGRAVVTATGMQTEMGRIAGLLEATPDAQTPLQGELNRTGKLLGLGVIVIAIVMIATIILVEEVRGAAAIFDVLILGVALAVAAVPEGLPAVVTAVLSLGVQRMARRNAIVRHLAAVETLGSASVIASDKTGTLTRNEMTVRVVVTASGRVALTGSGYTPEGSVQHADGGALNEALQTELRRALSIANRANNATIEQKNGKWIVHGDPTEGALLVAAQQAGVHSPELDLRFRRVGEVPFSAERKMMSTIHREASGEERLLVFTKGAPDVLLERCTRELVGDGTQPLNSQRRQEILGTVDELAGEALRTLAVAVQQLPDDMQLEQPEAAERELVFAGLLGIMDPPRAEAAAAVARALAAGIRPIMITGDHPRTASVIARELGIARDGRVITAQELAQLEEAERARVVCDISVYARVNPEDKLRIIGALRANGAVVAMTGDGVNDAPALKSADIGIAMGITGTDVAKQAADIILADDNFASIVAAVEEGRAIFANIRKFLRYLLSSNIGEVLTMFIGVLLARVIGLQQPADTIVLPLLATQILWINLVTDGPPALALGVDPADPGLMQAPPRPTGERVITGKMWRGIVYVGVIMAVGTLYVLDASLPGGLIAGAGSLPHAQTLAFTTLMLFQMFNVLNARSDERSAFTGLFRNHWLWGALAFSLLLQVVVIYVPFMQAAFGTVAMSLRDWMLCTVVASSVLWLRELSKLAERWSVRRSG
ncbi:MAG TPA: cation-translocating P-type ATPase [Longimicrobiales bacterium]